MPYQFTAAPDLFRIAFFGVLTPHDLHSVGNDLLAAEAALAVVPNRLTDLRQVTSIPLTYADMHVFVARRKMQPPANPVKSAIVAPQAVSLGFSRMFQILNDLPQVEVRIFPTVEEAEAWLAAP